MAGRPVGAELSAAVTASVASLVRVSALTQATGISVGACGLESVSDSPKTLQQRIENLNTPQICYLSNQADLGGGSHE